jgi:hypothetical protein
VINKKRLAKWDDNSEAEGQIKHYFEDSQLSAPKRTECRREEIEKDDRDREAEERESRKDGSRAETLAHSILAQQDFEIGAKVSPKVLSQPLPLRMTRENVKTKPASRAKRTVDEVEGILEEDAEQDLQGKSQKKRQLRRMESDGEPADKGLNNVRSRPVGLLLIIVHPRKAG